MGALAWARHAAKQPPLRDYPLVGPEGVRVIVRERPGSPLAFRYVATIRYTKPPQKGAYVITYAYGPTADAAEVRALDAYYNK